MTIALTELSKKIYARDAERKPWRTHVLSGTYTSSAPTGVEAKIIHASDSSTVVDWTALTSATIGGGTWFGTIRIPQGGEYKVSVRNAGNHSDVANGTYQFCVGLMILALGQSNMAGIFLGATTSNANTYWYNADPDAGGGVNAFGQPVGWASPTVTNISALLNEVNNLTGVPCAIMHAAWPGAAQEYALSVANGGTLVPADGSGGAGWDNWITARINACGNPFEFVIWHQGESGGDYYKHPTYAENLNLIHGQVCAISGRKAHQVKFLVASFNSSPVYTDSSYTTQVPHSADENIAHNLTQTALLNTRHTFPHIVLSHSSYGCAMNEETGDPWGGPNNYKFFLHYTSTEQTLNSARFGRTIAAILGGAKGHSLFEITHARAVDATTTDVFVRSGVASDFTGKTSPSGLTGFEVSGDNGTTWASPTANRLDAGTVRMTHAALPTHSARRIRYGYGWDVSIANPPVDGSAYASYLLPTATRYGIAAAALAQTASPVFTESRVDPYPGAGTPYPISDIPVGRWIKGNKVLVVAFSSGSGGAAQVLTITPNAGVPVVGTPITGAHTALQFWVAEIDGRATKINFVRSGAEIGRGQYSIWWVPKNDLTSITPVTASAHVDSASSVSTTLTFSANSIVFGAAGFGWNVGGTLTTAAPFAQRFRDAAPGHIAVFFDRYNETLATSSSMQVSGTGSSFATIQAIAFQANNVSTTQAAQAHNGGRSQINLGLWNSDLASGFINLLRGVSISKDYGPVNPAFINDRGWPTAVGVQWGVNFPNTTERPGDYIVRWRGTGTLNALVPDATVVGSTAGTDGRYIIRRTSPYARGVWLKVDAIDTGDPIRDIEFFHEDDEADLDAGKIFSARFLEVLRALNPGVLRFLDLSGAFGLWGTPDHLNPLDFSTSVGTRAPWAGITTNSGTNFSIARAGFVLEHGAGLMVEFNVPIGDPYISTLNVNGTGAKRIKNATNTDNADLHESGMFGPVVYDAIFDVWLFQGKGMFGAGVSRELIIELCNEIGAHPWVCFSYVGDTDVIEHIAALFREQLDPWLVPRFEYSNETWNPQFAQYSCNAQRAYTLWPSSTMGDGRPGEMAGRFMSLQGRRLAGVFGNDWNRYQNCCGIWSNGGQTSLAESEGRLTGQKTVYFEIPDHVADGGERTDKWGTHVTINNYWRTRYGAYSYFGKAQHGQDSYDLGREYAAALDANNDTTAQALREQVMVGRTAGLNDEYWGVNWQPANVYAPCVDMANSIGLKVNCYEGGISHDCPFPEDHAGANISNVTKAVQAIVTIDSDAVTPLVGDRIFIEQMNYGGMTEIAQGNTVVWPVIAVNGNQVTIGVDSTGFNTYVPGPPGNYYYNGIMRYSGYGELSAATAANRSNLTFSGTWPLPRNYGMTITGATGMTALNGFKGTIDEADRQVKNVGRTMISPLDMTGQPAYTGGAKVLFQGFNYWFFDLIGTARWRAEAVYDMALTDLNGCAALGIEFPSIYELQDGDAWGLLGGNIWTDYNASPYFRAVRDFNSAGTVVLADAITTEAGDQITTEAGDAIFTEGELPSGAITATITEAQARAIEAITGSAPSSISLIITEVQARSTETLSLHNFAATGFPSSLPDPLRDSYMIEPQPVTVRTDMEAGAARVRRRFTKQIERITVGWILDETQLSAFKTFYDTGIQDGSQWFDMPLDLGAGNVQCECRFIDRYSLRPLGMGRWRVDAQLEKR